MIQLLLMYSENGDHQSILEENNISIERLKLDKYFKEKKIQGYLKSRYYQIKIFFLAFYHYYV